MNYTYTDELYHHGIKGQKWGVRRFQNEDGSYTSAGRERYSSGEQTAHDKVRALRKQRSSDYKKANLQYRSTMKKIGKETQAGEEQIERKYKKSDTLSDEDLKKQNDLYRRQDEKALKAVNKYDHDRRDIKTSYKKQIKDVKNSPEYKAERNEKIKKAMIGAAVVGGVALAAYGGYKLSQSKKKFGSYSSNGKAYMESANRNRAIDNAYASLFEKASVQYRLGQDDKGRMTEFAKKSTEANVNRLKYENKSEDAYNKARRTAYYKLHTKKGKQKLDSKYGAHNAAQYTYSAIYNNPNDWSATIREQYSHETKKNKPSYLAEEPRFLTSKKKKRGR